jgi:hypothetical protein
MMGSGCVPDLAGHHYYETFRILHAALRPNTYFEIGTLHGDTLSLARCASISVDPGVDFSRHELVAGIIDKPQLHLFKMTSDEFFASQDPERILGAKIDMAFLDGMHRCEFLLRDFMNTERFCKPNSLVVLHDCIPVEAGMTARSPSAQPPLMPHRQGWWTGDVWRTALLLKRVRPDLSISAIDAQSTGLVLVTNLSPASHVLNEGYARHVKLMLSWDLGEIGLSSIHEELGLESAANLATDEQVTGRFWL